MKSPVISANDLKWRLRYFLLYRTSRDWTREIDTSDSTRRASDASRHGGFYERVISAGS